VTSTHTPTASYTAFTATYNLTTGGNTNCTAGGGGTTCNISIPAPTGAADFTFVLYNVIPATSTTFATTAKALGWALVPVTVIAGSNTLAVVVAGVADHYNTLVNQSGAVGMMGLNSQTALGFAGTGTTLALTGSTVLQAGSQAVGTTGILAMDTAAGTSEVITSGQSVVLSIPAVATAQASPIPVKVADSVGTCGVSGTSHTQLTLGGTSAGLSGNVVSAGTTIALTYGFGTGGVGYFSTTTVSGQTTDYTYTLSTLGVTSTSADFSCANQTVSFTEPNETALMTISEHAKTSGFSLIMPGSGAMSCSNVAQFFDLTGTGTSLGPTTGVLQTSHILTGTTFTIKEINTPTIAQQCIIGISDSSGTVTYMDVNIPSGGSGTI